MQECQRVPNIWRQFSHNPTKSEKVVLFWEKRCGEAKNLADEAVLNQPVAGVSKSEECRRAFLRTRVQVPSRRCDRDLPESRLDQVNRSASIQRVRSVSVAEPMWRNREIDSCAGCRPAHDAQYGHRFQTAVFPRPEYRIVFLGIPT